MLGREKKQILTRKQLFKGKGKLFCFFLVFILAAQTSCSLRSCYLWKKKAWYCLTSSSSDVFFTPSRGTAETVLS